MNVSELNDEIKRKTELLKQINNKIIRLEGRSDELFRETRELYKFAWNNGFEWDDEKEEWKLKEEP